MTDGEQRGRAGDFLGPLVSSMLNDAQSRKSSIEQRALAIISSAGVLVSLLIALAAFLLTAEEESGLGVIPRVLLAFAAVCFVVAAALGLWVNTPREHGGMDDEDLDRIVSQGMWHGDANEARQSVAERQIEELKVFVCKNNRKGRLVQYAVGVQVLGVALVAAAILWALVVK